MARALHLIYVPGLGDSNRVTGQRLALATWRLWGVHAELFPAHWSDGEPWEAKLARLLQRIDELNDRGLRVGLVGASAGASAVMNAYAKRTKTIVGCALIEGRVNRPGAIGARYARENPAFVASLQQCQSALTQLDSNARARIMSSSALADRIVPRSDSFIAGARNRTVFSVGHAVSIALQITLGAPLICRFLKRAATRI